MTVQLFYTEHPSSSCRLKERVGRSHTAQPGFSNSSQNIGNQSWEIPHFYIASGNAGQPLRVPSAVEQAPLLKGTPIFSFTQVCEGFGSGSVKGFGGSLRVVTVADLALPKVHHVGA
ncbi:hypothetical protein NPIL_1961 [Nephila pilipes]|uniref:Uncharacterized protein n=1 Tax=Nephila pilipes TaxID=299642 RepID=A0A8X6PU78_NEPPI|nr:hypothetical protein NPIL_1961 [Nephila pilipes]